jgi:hypothetical protein
MTARLILISALLFLGATGVFAQLTPVNNGKEHKVIVSGMAGYNLGGYAAGYYGEATIRGNVGYVGAIDFLLRRDVMLELSYSYMNSNADIQTYGYDWDPVVTGGLDDVTVQFIQIGSLKTFRRGNVAPFIGGNLGVAVIAPNKTGYETDTFFAVSGVGGAMVYLSESVGLRFQARLLVPVAFQGFGFYLGTGGSGLAATGQAMLMGELTGGLFVAF